MPVTLGTYDIASTRCHWEAVGGYMIHFLRFLLSFYSFSHLLKIYMVRTEAVQVVNGTLKSLQVSAEYVGRYDNVLDIFGIHTLSSKS